MYELHDEFVPKEQDAIDSTAADGCPAQKPDGWLRRTLAMFRERNNCITTMTPDGRIDRIERVEG